MKISELLLPWDEFNKTEHPQPYIYKIEADGKNLVYFGAQHSLDPGHRQNELICKEWENFIAKSAPGKRMVVAEAYAGGPFIDTVHAVMERGESGLISYLAGKENMEVVVPGLGKQEQMRACEKYFERDMILYHHALQVALQRNRMMKKPPFDQFIEKFLTRDKEGTGWSDVDFTFEHVKAVHERLFGTPFNEDDKEFFSKMTDPSQSHGITNEISRRQNDMREIVIVETILRMWDEGNSVFVVMGSGHAVIEEPALRALLQGDSSLR